MEPLDWTLVISGVVVSLALMLVGLATIAHVTPTRRPNSGYLFSFVVLGSLGAVISIAQFVRHQIVPNDQLQILQRQLNDLSQFASDTKRGIETMRASPLARKGAPPKRSDATVSSSAEPAPVNPGANAAATPPLRITTRQIDAAKGAAPFALEIIILADVAIATPSFKIECDGPISDAKFLVAGAAAVTGARTVRSGNNIFLSFASPTVQPETPVVVTLSSESRIAVIKVSQSLF